MEDYRAKGVFKSKRTGEWLQRLGFNLPLNLSKRLEKESAKQGIAKVQVLIQILEKTLPKLGGRPKS
ncbi:MAG: hypothetical protein ACI86H_002467 [bacterium]|jgi:hypothetical protein